MTDLHLGMVYPKNRRWWSDKKVKDVTCILASMGFDVPSCVDLDAYLRPKLLYIDGWAEVGRQVARGDFHLDIEEFDRNRSRARRLLQAKLDMMLLGMIRFCEDHGHGEAVHRKELNRYEQTALRGSK